MVELMVVGFLCIRLDFLVEIVVLVKGVGGFGFLIHSDFLVEVVVMLRAVGGGGCGYGFLGLSLVVVELGLGVSATLYFMGFFMGEYEIG